MIQLLEQIAGRRSRKEIRETNISAWRRSVCGDLSAAFQPFESGSGALPFPPRDAFFEQVHREQFTRLPSGYKPLGPEDVSGDVSWMPRQEQGVRPSLALPYELAASGALNADAAEFETVLKARNSAFGKAVAGAPFHVYTPGKFCGGVKLRMRAYAVVAGGKLSDAWALEGLEQRAYRLRVCGPNGFLREFAGNAEDPRLEIVCDYTRRGGWSCGSPAVRSGIGRCG